MRLNTKLCKVRKLRWMSLSLLTLALVCGLSRSAAGQPATKEQSVSPGVNNSFLSPDLDVNRWVATLKGKVGKFCPASGDYRSRAAAAGHDRR
jgi:hypothetical protein